MAEISATMVKQLRDRTGQAMMDCKKALAETDGDMEKAIELLRKKGMAVLEKRGGRETTEGRMVGKISADGKIAVLTTLCSETDFTAKSDDFQKAAQALAEGLLQAANTPDSPQAALELDTNDGKKVGDVVNDIISKTGEKITIGEFARYQLDGPGLLYCYVHFNSKVGSLVQLDADSDAAITQDAVKTLAADLAMHATATNPLAVSRDDIDPQAIAQEKEIAAAQVQNKPEHIVEKIVDGKLNKWFQQVALLEQPFVKDDSKTVKQLIEEVASQAQSKLTLKRFRRLEIG
jgi:elongation factor Ts